MSEELDGDGPEIREMIREQDTWKTEKKVSELEAQLKRTNEVVVMLIGTLFAHDRISEVATNELINHLRKALPEIRKEPSNK
jgi:hypothetical protein